MAGRTVLWALSALIAVTVASRTFQGDKVISTIPQTEEQLEHLKYLERYTDIDFWKHPLKTGVAVDMHVTPSQLSLIQSSFTERKMKYRVKITDIQSLVDKEKDVHKPMFFSEPDVLTRYGSQPEIDTWLHSAARDCGSRCTLMPFGTSLEGRAMTAIKIVSSGSAGSKPAVFVDGGIHAREWISPAFVNNMIDKLINDYGSDSDVSDMLDAYDWYILPLLNPDGYQYSHENDRMWRKNRAETKRKRCRGVDLNRNFGYEWGVDGVSTNPCSEIYLGPSAFSEPESQALKDFLASIDNLEVYLSFHAYGQYFLFPWGYGAVRAPNHDDLDDVGKAAANAIKAINGEDWIVGNAAIELYPAAGASDDWAYGGAGATYAYCIELPPNDADGSGFILPESRIPEVVNSVWPGIKEMMKTIIQKQSRGVKTHKSAVETALLQDGEWWSKVLLKKQKQQAQSRWEPKYF